jgi:PAS domain S-box-containing protein
LNHQLVLVIEPDVNQDDRYSLAIEQHARLVGLSVSSTHVTKAVDDIKESTAAGIEPAVVLFGPNVPNALAVARRIRSVWPIGQMLFVTDALQLEKLQRELRYAPMIGPNWSLVEISDLWLPQKIQKSAQASRQRARLRTTLDRANLTLSAPKTVDSLQYRRMVVSEHYLANLLEQSQDAIISLDIRNTVLYWNRSTERLFQQSADSVYGTHVAKLHFWSPSLDSCLQRIHTGISTLTAETSYALPDANLDLEILMSSVRDNTGRLIGISLVLRDISFRNQMLEVERARRREAEQTSKMKDEFLAVLSHELRTPLTAVIGRTQLLKFHHRNEPDLLSSLNVIERNAQLQAKLIEDLLDTSLIVTGKLHLKLQLVSIRQVVEAAVELIRPTAEHKQITLSEVFHPVVGFVHGDPHRLQQVFINLLMNATKFTPQDGNIDVTLSQAGSHFEVAVSDNGVGIDPEFLPYVFDKFGQEDVSITRRYGGLGLGLSITKHLVKLHGGDVHASSPGRNMGARFTVSLPVHDLEIAGKKEVSPNEPEKECSDILAGRRILVVDDVADARDFVIEVLEAYGAEVIAVESGAAALQTLKSFHPDVLVSDIGMPDMDGYELIERIRAQGCTSEKLPALALTAFASPADRDAAIRAGYQTHLAKPLIVTELTSAVERLLAS